MFDILVTEDDKNTRRLIKEILVMDGYNVFTAENGGEALELMDRQHIDLIVLDVMMPVMDGFELTKELRSNGFNVPVLMVTARQDSSDKRKGFVAGADDYITKPFDREELLLRVKALLRRAGIASEHKLRVGEVVMDYDSLTVTKNGQATSLPQKEFYLLFKLLSNPGMIFTRLQLMDEIWGMDSETDERTVNVHINRLRDRFGEWEEFDIVTVRGLGYKAVKTV